MSLLLPPVEIRRDLIIVKRNIRHSKDRVERGSRIAYEIKPSIRGGAPYFSFIRHSDWDRYAHDDILAIDLNDKSIFRLLFSIIPFHTAFTLSVKRESELSVNVCEFMSSDNRGNAREF